MRPTATPRADTKDGRARRKIIARSILALVVAAGLALATLTLFVAAPTDLALTLIGLTVLAVLSGLHFRRQRLMLRRWRAQSDERVAGLERTVNDLGRKLDELLGRRTDAESAVRSLSVSLQESLTRNIGRSTENLRRAMVREVKTAYHELEALQNLYAMVPVTRRVPPLRGWAASPDLLLLLVELLRAERPKLLVECGSGASTLWTALAVQRFDLETRVVALEHDEKYARETTGLLHAHGVAGIAEVRHAPLEEVRLDGTTWQWYARDGWADLHGIGLLFVDGPPGKTGPQARFPALPLLGERLTDEAVVVLDDLIRTDEQEIVERWLKAAPAVWEERLALEKGASVLRRKPDASGAWTQPPRPTHSRDGADRAAHLIGG